MRIVHWKASATGGKLFSRTYTEEDRNCVGLLVDFSPIGAEPEEAMVLEDKIIESLLATANYFWKKHTRVQLFHGIESNIGRELATNRDLEVLYTFCCEIKFQSVLSMEDIVTIAASKMGSNVDFILFTATLTKGLFTRLDILQKNGVMATIFYMEGKEKHPLQELFEQEFTFILIPYQEEPCPILEGD